MALAPLDAATDDLLILARESLEIDIADAALRALVLALRFECPLHEPERIDDSLHLRHARHAAVLADRLRRELAALRLAIAAANRSLASGRDEGDDLPF